jgi:mono/diheme cytochrome c family protein
MSFTGLQSNSSREATGRAWWPCLLMVATLCLTGCGQPTASYSLNQVYLRKQEHDQMNGDRVPATQVKDLANVLTALYGTPDDPHMPPGVEGIDTVLNMTRVKAAAGRVASDEYGKGEGLYRQHCVHCHGITGNGKGPTATFLNPYPRDFTAGIFKFDSTPIGYKPTHEDLRRVIMEGIAGTAMPSFKLLSEGEVEALIDYVKFLSIRGETERKLLEQIGEFVPGEQDDATAVEKLRTDFQSRELLVDDVLTEVIESWNAAKDNVTEIPVRPATYDRFSAEFDETALQASEERGRKLYYTNVANCYSCHGPSQLGDGQVTDYDKWTKDFYDWTKKTEKDYPERLAEYEARGGLPLRNILPRNLRDGIYRGGRRPIDIFWRVHNGIDGTPMPAANKQALQDNDIWDIVNYVLSLPYEPVSRPGLDTLTNDRGVR